MKTIYSNVLIVSTGRLGDFISSFVVINTIKRVSKNIDIVCRGPYEDIVNNEEGLNVVSAGKAVNVKYDLLFDLTATSSTRSLSRKVDAAIKVGTYRSFIRKVKYYLLNVYTYSFRARPFDNIVKDYFPYTQAVGLSCDPVPILRMLSKPKLSSLFDLKNKKFCVGVHISATDPVRCISMDLVRKIVKYIDCIGGSSILIGDRERADEIGINLESVYFREESVSELIATVSQLDYLIAPDSGVLHLASALNTKSLGLYGVNLSSDSGPPAETVDFIELNLDCRPCNNRFGCEYNVRCMNDISFSAVKKYIDRYCLCS